MSRSLRPIDIFPITTRFLQVLRTADVTPGMRRVTLGGEQLKAHTAPNGFPVAEFRSHGFDDEFKILIKHPDVAEAIGPTQADGVLNWPRGDEHMLMRTYTARRWDPEKGELDVDFVVHGVGPATSWARNATIGETIQIAGPKSSATHPEGADWVLIGGDETALPAIGRWLEEWPTGARGQVFIEVAEQSHRQLDLPVPDGVELSWLVRDGAEAGTTTLLFDALSNADWWEGTVFAWVAGEAGTLKPIRRWLRNEKKLPKDQIEITGYWRKQEVKASEDNPELPDFEATTNAREVFHELAELTPGFALRVAASIGLGQALGDQRRTLDELSSTTGGNRIGVEKLLNYLSAIDVVDRNSEGYQLTDIGRDLDDDAVIERLSLTQAHAEKELTGLLALLGAVREGTQTPFIESPAALQQRLESENHLGGYYAAALAPAPVFDGARHLLLSGRASVAFAREILSKRPGLNATIVASADEHAVLRLPEAVTAATEFTDADIVLLIDPISALNDEAAIDFLSAAAAHGRLLVFTSVLDHKKAHDHEYAEDLQNFAMYGGGSRTSEEFHKIFHSAGLPTPARSTVGWGLTLFDFER